MQALDTNVQIKMSREVELNMERCAEFMARMIQKYGKKVMDNLEAQERTESGGQDEVEK